MKEYQVNFTAHHIINVEAETEEQAREKAIDLFDGQVDWENEVEEVEQENYCDNQSCLKKNCKEKH